MPPTIRRPTTFAHAFLAPALAALALVPSVPRAQVMTRFDVDPFHPAPMAECSLAVGCAEVGDAGAFRAALLMTSASTMLVERDGPTVGGAGLGSPTANAQVVSLRTSAHLLLAVAVVDGLEVHADLPAVLSQDDSAPANPGIPAPSARGLGAPLLGVRWTAWSQRRGAPGTLALKLDALPPLGSQEALAANTGWVVRPGVETALWSGEGVFTSELGMVLRQDPVQLGLDRLQHQIFGAVAIAGLTHPLRAEFGVRGTWSRQGGSVEATLGARVEAGPLEFFCLLGPAFGTAPGTPQIRGMLGFAWVSTPGGELAAADATAPAGGGS